MDAAIESYARDGEQGLTTKNLAKVADCSEALIYRHFKSKDDLLRACYLRLHKRANDNFEPMAIPEDIPISELVKISKEYWIKIFTFYVDAGYEALFYYWFRLSDSFGEMLREDNGDLKKVYASSFMNTFENIRVRYNLQISAEHYRTFMVFFMGTFVTQVVKGKLPKTEESYRMIADLLFGGLLSTVSENSLEEMAKTCNR